MITSHNTRQLQRIFREYEAAGFPLPAALKDVADWAIRTGRWKAPASIEVSVCAREIGRAIREEYITDDRGKRVRVKHSVLTKRGDQTLHLWHDVRRADRGHMELAFAQRRMRIVGDCHQLHSDVEWYNDHHPEADSIQLVLDFTPDVAELDAVIATDRTVAQVVRRDELDDDQNPELEPDPALPTRRRTRERFRPTAASRRTDTPATINPGPPQAD